MFLRDKVWWIRVETLGQHPNKYDFDPQSDWLVVNLLPARSDDTQEIAHPSRLRKQRQPIKAGKWRDIQKQIEYLYQTYMGTFMKI